MIKITSLFLSAALVFTMAEPVKASAVEADWAEITKIQTSASPSAGTLEFFQKDQCYAARMAKFTQLIPCRTDVLADIADPNHTANKFNTLRAYMDQNPYFSWDVKNFYARFPTSDTAALLATVYLTEDQKDSARVTKMLKKSKTLEAQEKKADEEHNKLLAEQVKAQLGEVSWKAFVQEMRGRLPADYVETAA